MKRPFFNKSITDLEGAYKDGYKNPDLLKILLDELNHRSTKRSDKLKQQIKNAISENNLHKRVDIKDDVTLKPIQKVEPASPAIPRQEIPKIENKPEDILSAWSALEVLSPPTFDKPEKLAGGDKLAVADIRHKVMPWENGVERGRKNQKLYYHIILGSIKMDESVADLMKIYADKRAEKPLAKGRAILASVTVNKEGQPVGESMVTIASFGWGVSRALKGHLKDLGNWSATEKELIEGLEPILNKTDENGEIAQLNYEVIQNAYNWLIKSLELPSHLVCPPEFVLRTYQYYKNAEPPEALILNSFFLNDLEKAKLSFQGNKATANLRRYLGVIQPQYRHNLLVDSEALEETIAPSLFPISCWSGQGHHPLVLLQQSGVNLAGQVLEDEGILAVNGPPGTGKTTLLRDVVAEIITKRAKAMSAFENPSEAFKHTGKKIKAGNGWLHLYELHQSIRGHEILIASSNNKAVENVSAELPGIDSIADDVDLRYFKTISDILTGKDSWGLIAGVLGNSQNRYDFKQSFWWDKDFGLATYLAEASGTPQFIEEKDKTTRKPHVIKNENPPKNANDALLRWKAAQQKFNSALDQAEDAINKFEVIRVKVKILSALKDQKNAIADLRYWKSKWPGFWAWLFQLSHYREWKSEYTSRQIKLRKIEHHLRKLQKDINLPTLNMEAISVEIEQCKKRLGLTIVDEEFHSLDHDVKQGLSPWLDNETHKLREKVFIEAMKLHKTFIDSAAKPIRHNLGVLMNVWDGKSLRENNDLLPDLWASLFLIVPALSTTFASVDRMIGKLPADSLGWLLIDEAGQALPQASVGAIMRTKRAFIVGDPIQIEPIVALPDTLTESICRQFGIDSDDYNAPTASTQTLADTATPYMAEFASQGSSRTVGIPLLVHRRCREPMFGISNSIAYENLMINKKVAKTSDIENCLGPSQWFHIEGAARDKWSKEEGQMVLSLLSQLKDADVYPDLYIVTPFVVVQDNLRRIIRDKGILKGWVDNPKWVYERIGTVHTVQGREAEAVIFVLGAPELKQQGARGWAGGRPNLLNVAVTRAKEVLYVIGNRELWKNSGTFKQVDSRL